MNDGTQTPDPTQPQVGPPPGSVIKPLGPPPGAIIKPITPQSITSQPVTPQVTPTTTTAAPPVGDVISGPAQAPALIRGLRAAKLYGLSGFLQSGAETLVGLHDLDQRINRSLGLAERPTDVEKNLEAQGLHPTDNPVMTAMRHTANVEPANWMEQQGRLTETGGELFSGEELLSLLSDMGKGALSLKAAASLSDTLTKYPRIAKLLRIGLNSAKAGGEMGAQTYVKTGGDVGAAQEAAATGAATGAVLEGGSAATRAFLERNAAVRDMVGGVETVIPGNVRRAAATPQQVAGRQAIRASAQDTLAQRLGEVNESRAVPPSPTALPARTGPFEFELQGVPTAEQTSGQGVVPAAEMPRRNITGLPTEPVAGSESARNVQQLGSTAQATPARLMRDQPYMTSAAPGAEPETVGRPTGGGALRTQDPNVARQHIGNLNDIIDSPDFGRMPAEQQQQIVAARTDAQQQMAQYRDHLQSLSPRAGRPNFPQIDIPAAVQKYGGYTEAGEHLEDIATGGYNSISDALALNDISGGKFNAVRNANKEAWAAYKGASPEGLSAAENRLDETNRMMQDLLQKDIGGAVTPKELSGFNDAYGQAQIVKRVGNAVDRSFSGNRSTAAKSWEYTGFDGNQLMRNLDHLVNSPSIGRAAVERAIGANNLNTLYQVAELNRTNVARARFGAATSPITKWLGENGVSFRGHFGAGVLGGLAGEATGIGWGKGAMVGVSADWAARKVMNAIMTNPKIAENVIFALDHAVQPKVYGPLIGSMIVQMEAQQKEQPEGQEQPQP